MASRCRLAAPLSGVVGIGCAGKSSRPHLLPPEQVTRCQCFTPVGGPGRDSRTCIPGRRGTASSGHRAWQTLCPPALHEIPGGDLSGRGRGPHAWVFQKPLRLHRPGSGVAVSKMKQRAFDCSRFSDAFQHDFLSVYSFFKHFPNNIFLTQSSLVCIFVPHDLFTIQLSSNRTNPSCVTFPPLSFWTARAMGASC